MSRSFKMNLFLTFKCNIYTSQNNMNTDISMDFTANSNSVGHSSITDPRELPTLPNDGNWKYGDHIIWNIANKLIFN